MSSTNIPKGIFGNIAWLNKWVKWLIHKINSGGGGTLPNISSTPTASYLPLYRENGTGQLRVADPVQSGDAVNLKTLSAMITGVNRVYSEDTENFVFDRTGYYTHDGDENLVRVLPDVSTSAGTRYVILNTTGLGELEIQGDIFESGTLISTFNITQGENYIIYNNGAHWVIV